MSKTILFEDRNNDWEIWEKNNSIERSIKRIQNKLPEMEASNNFQKLQKILQKKLVF